MHAHTDGTFRVRIYRQQFNKGNEVLNDSGSKWKAVRLGMSSCLALVQVSIFIYLSPLPPSSLTERASVTYS